MLQYLTFTSIFVWVQDVSVMYMSYLQGKAMERAMERAKDVEDRSKGDQYTPMVSFLFLFVYNSSI